MQGTLGQRAGWPVPRQLRRGDPVTGRPAGWRRGEAVGPGAPLAVGPGQRRLRQQPAVRASAPCPAKDDGSVALGFMVSLEGRRAGRFPRDSAPFPHAVPTEQSERRRTRCDGKCPGPPPHPPARAVLAYRGSALVPSPPLGVCGGFRLPLMLAPPGTSLLTRDSDEQTHAPSAE